MVTQLQARTDEASGPISALGHIEQAETLPVTGRYDVIVIGGGVAGIAAAISAGRLGASTLLIERAGALGGTATTSLMSLIVTPFSALHGFAKEFFQRLSERQDASVPDDAVTWDPEGYKLLTAEMCIEAGVDILLYTMFSRPIVEDGRVTGVIVENKSGRQAYLAHTVIDSSGDADVVVRAGGVCVVGREKDQAMRPVTVMGRLADVDLKALAAYVDDHPEDFGQDKARRILQPHSGGIVRIDGFYSVIDRAKADGVLGKDEPVNYLRFSGLVRADPRHADVICNSTRIYGVDGTDARSLSDAEIAGRRQLAEIVAAIKEYLPGFENSYLIETSSQLGVRETRRIVGRYTLTWEDVAARAPFPDSVGALPSRDYGTAGVHEPDAGSEGRRDDAWAREMEINTIFFELPFRCLVPRDLEGILVAGRCVSLTHDADRFVRSQHAVVFTGQAAGVAAALAARAGVESSAVPVEELQRELARAGVRVHVGDE